MQIKIWIYSNMKLSGNELEGKLHHNSPSSFYYHSCSCFCSGYSACWPSGPSKQCYKFQNRISCSSFDFCCVLWRCLLLATVKTVSCGQFYTRLITETMFNWEKITDSIQSQIKRKWKTKIATENFRITRNLLLLTYEVSHCCCPPIMEPGLQMRNQAIDSAAVNLKCFIM